MYHNYRFKQETIALAFLIEPVVNGVILMVNTFENYTKLSTMKPFEKVKFQSVHEREKIQNLNCNKLGKNFSRGTILYSRRIRELFLYWHVCCKNKSGRRENASCWRDAIPTITRHARTTRIDDSDKSNIKIRNSIIKRYRLFFQFKCGKRCLIINWLSRMTLLHLKYPKCVVNEWNSGRKRAFSRIWCRTFYKQACTINLQSIFHIYSVHIRSDINNA